MTSPAYSILYSAVVHGAASSGSPGDVLIPSSAGQPYVISSTANRGSRRSTGVALSTYTANGVVEIQQCGRVESSISGLGAGSASWVRVSSAGRLERCTPEASDDVVGRCDADGTFHACFGVLTPGMTVGDLQITVGPAGTGAVYVTDGTADEVQINAAIVAVNALGGGVVKLLAGTFNIASPVTLLSNVTLQGSGIGVTKMLMVTASFATTNYFMVGALGYELGASTTTAGTAIALTSNAVMGTKTLAFNSSAWAGAIAVGDYLYLASDALWETTNQSGRKTGEYVEVDTVGATSVTLLGCTRDDYNTADNASLYRMSFVTNVAIRDIEFSQTGALNTFTGSMIPLVAFEYVRRGEMTGCYLHDYDGPASVVYQSLDVKICGNTISRITDNTASNRYGYGCLIGGASERVVVGGNTVGYCRHAFDAGPPKRSSGTATANNGIPRAIDVSNNTVTKTSDASISTHSEADGWAVEGNHVSHTSSTAIFMRGRGCKVTNNVVEWANIGIAIGDPTFNTSGGSGSGCHVTGNTVRYIKGGSTNCGIVTNLTDKVLIHGNTISECGRAGIYVRTQSVYCTYSHNTIVDCNLDNSVGNVSDGIVLEAGKTGTLATIAFAGTTCTLTKTGAGWSDVLVSRTITISGSGTSANNGTFTILTVPDTQTLTYTNASGANSAADVSYAIENSTDNLFANNVVRNTPASRYARGSVGLIASLSRDYGAAGCNERNRYINNVGLGMTASVGSLIRFSSPAPTFELFNNYDATNTATYSGNQIQRIITRVAKVATTDATQTTLFTFTMIDETTCAFDVVVTASLRTSVTKAARYKRSVVYRRTGAGNATIVGTLESGTDQETDAAWDVTIDSSTTQVRVRVTGAAATNINWSCEMRIQETSNL